MQLTQVERQMLYNQCKILKSLYPDDEEKMEFNMTILERGYSSKYSYVFDVNDNEHPKEIEDFYTSVLFMFAKLVMDYNNLKESERTSISERDIYFNGFNGAGDNAAELYAYSLFAKDFNKFYMCFNEYYNEKARMRSTDECKRMLSVFNETKKSMKDNEHLTREQIVSIIGAK